MYIFGCPKGMPCATLGNCKSQDCGMPRGSKLTQRSLASTIHTSSKDVLGAFGLNKEEKIMR